MCLSVFPQEIQPGHHHKALLGRKVSVCMYNPSVCMAWQACVFPSSDVGAISPTTGYTLKQLQSVTWHPTFQKTHRRTDMEDTLDKMSDTHTDFNMAMFSPPPASLHTLPQLSCQTAKSHICFFCHAEVFCSQSALVTFALFLKVLRLVLKDIDAPEVHSFSGSLE